MRRDLQREIRSIVPAVVREDLSAAGLLVVEYRTLKSAHRHMEKLVDMLTCFPTSHHARQCMPEAQRILSMLDSMMESVS